MRGSGKIEGVCTRGGSALEGVATSPASGGAKITTCRTGSTKKA